MELLSLRLGDTALALIPRQISRVGLWGENPVKGRVALTEALGLGGAEPCARELIRASSEGDVAFGIAGALTQAWAEPGTIVAPSRALRRLGAPGWLAGFFNAEGGLQLIVDLAFLSTAALPPRDDSR